MMRCVYCSGKGWALVTEPGAVATGSKIQVECKHPVATAPGSVAKARLIVALREQTRISVRCCGISHVRRFRFQPLIHTQREGYDECIRTQGRLKSISRP